VRGFRRAVYTGLTTREMARVIEGVLVRNPDLSGVFHVASEPITKFELLTALAGRLGRDARIEADDAFACDRSLHAGAFAAATGYRAPSWGEMLDELAEEVRARETRA
jgi:dTDP-4-dehydrorhamnose reductase